MTGEPSRRFYEIAAVSTDGLGVLLDTHTLRTPGGNVFRAPTPALALAIAAEWAAQGERVVPATMPLTQLAFAALDHTPGRRDELSAWLAKYIETDLVCHRADAPTTLVERQAAAWDPIVEWAEERFHMRLPVVTGIIAAEISPQNLTVLEWEVDDLDDFRCTALAQAVTLAGSALIGFALLEGRLDSPAAFAAATVDEAWSLERWGEDAEARAKLESVRSGLEGVARFVAALA